MRKEHPEKTFWKILGKTEADKASLGNFILKTQNILFHLRYGTFSFFFLKEEIKWKHYYTIDSGNKFYKMSMHSL